jgi:hypothetical protein
LWGFQVEHVVVTTIIKFKIIVLEWSVINLTFSLTKLFVPLLLSLDFFFFDTLGVFGQINDASKLILLVVIFVQLAEQCIGDGEVAEGDVSVYIVEAKFEHG